MKVKGNKHYNAADSLFLNNINEKKVFESYYAKTPKKHVIPSGAHKEKRAAWVPTGDNTNSEHPVMRMPSAEAHANGTNRFPVILVSGNGTTNCDSAAYSNRLNASNYNIDGHTGSVREYFESQSQGKFCPTYDVYVVTTSLTLKNYKDNEGAVVKAAITALKNKYKNFNASQYDSDGDGEIDACGIIYAGTEDDNNGLGGFQYELQWNSEGKQDAGNGKVFNNYFIIAQMYSSSTLLQIATFVHEFSHTMGLRDHYSVYTYPTSVQVQFPGAHAWDVMSTGMYNNDGATPAGYSAFEKEFMGWISTKTLTTSDATTAITALNTTNLAYKVPVKGDDDEFYLLENRQLTGWDAALPNHGMLIWHIDYDQIPWDADSMNDHELHQRIDVVEAGNLAVTSYYDGFSSEHLIDDPFPGSQNVTTFTNFKSWAGVDQGIKLYNITEKDGVIYFTTSQNSSVDTDTKADTTGSEVVTPVEESKTLAFNYTVDLPISTNFDAVKVDLTALFDSLGIKNNANSLYQSGSLEYTALNPDGTKNSMSSSAYVPGHWFDENGNPSSYNDGYIYSEFTLDSMFTKVGHYPNKVSAGQTYTVKQAWTYNKIQANMTITINIVNAATSVTAVKSDAVIAVKNQHIALNGLANGNKTVNIFNAKGQLIYNVQFAETSKVINLSNVNNQMVVVKVFGENQDTVTKKVILKK